VAQDVGPEFKPQYGKKKKKKKIKWENNFDYENEKRSLLSCFFPDCV
jgi:hypothetical protein